MLCVKNALMKQTFFPFVVLSSLLFENNDFGSSAMFNNCSCHSNQVIAVGSHKY